MIANNNSVLSHKPMFPNMSQQYQTLSGKVVTRTVVNHDTVYFVVYDPVADKQTAVDYDSFLAVQEMSTAHPLPSL